MANVQSAITESQVIGSNGAATTTTTTSSMTVVGVVEGNAADLSLDLTVKKQQQQPKLRSLVPERWGDQVRPVGLAEHKEAGLSIAQAFATDELAHYLLDSDDMAALSEEARWRLHVDMMKYIVAAHCLSGLVTTIGPDYEGVALW